MAPNETSAGSVRATLGGHIYRATNERARRTPPTARTRREEDVPMTEQSHGRYYAQEVTLDAARGVREQIQEALDAGEAQDWNLVGASDVPTSGADASGAGETRAVREGAPPEHGATARAVILLWDTARPSFGRSA